MKKEKKLFNIVRGGAICFVVLGHVIQCIISPDNFDDNIFFRIIYSFHMPLFMFISGSLVYNPERSLNIQWLVKKFKTVAIPFIVWIPIVYVADNMYESMSFEDYLMHVMERPDYAKWFLWVLFLLHLLMFILMFMRNCLNYVFDEKLEPQNKQLFIECGLYVFIEFFLLPVLNSVVPILGIGMCRWYFNFYFLGYICNKLNFIQKACEWRKRLIVVPLFMCSAMYWERTGNVFIARDWLDVIIQYPKMVSLIIRVYKYLVPSLGIFSVFGLLTYLPARICKFLAFLGVHTMPIYLIHVYLLKNYCRESVAVSAIIAFVLSLTIPIAVEKFSEYIGISGLLFGKYKMISC